MANVIAVELDLDTLKAGNKLDKFGNKAKSRGKKAGDNFGGGFGKGFKQVLAGNLGADAIKGVIRGITGELGNIVNAGKSLEVIKTQFKTLLGSTEAAEKQMRQLQAFAAKTPFEIEGLALSTRQLISFGVANEKIIPTMSRLGDIAAGVGADISDLTIPFGRLISTQKLTLIELDKFQDKGVNIFGELSKQTGISMANIRKAITDGTIPFSEFDKALTSLTTEGGKFFKGMEAQSKTLDGALSNFSDTLFSLRGSLGQTFSPVIIAIVTKLSTELDKLSGSVESIDAAGLARNFIAVNDAIITNVIAPMELIVNTVGFVGLKFAEGMNAMVASVGFLGEKLAEFLNFMGVDAPAGLKIFAESSQEIFEESSAAATESFDKIFDFPVSAKMAEINEELGTALDEMNTVIVDKGTTVGETLKVGVTSIATTISGVVKSVWDNLKFGLDETTNSILINTKKVASIVKGAMVKGISGGIQTIVKSLMSGRNAFEDFGKFILGVVGGLAIQLGEFFIAQGLAVKALKNSPAAPSAAIAAGVGLVALGSILQSFGGGSSSSSSGGGGGGSGEGATAVANETFDEPDSFEERTTSTVVNLNVQGVVAGDKTEVATFVQGILNEANEKNGIIQLNTRTA